MTEVKISQEMLKKIRETTPEQIARSLVGGFHQVKRDGKIWYLTEEEFLMENPTYQKAVESGDKEQIETIKNLIL